MGNIRFAGRAANLGISTPAAVPPDLIRMSGGNAFPDLLPDVSHEAAHAAKQFRTEALQYGPLFGIPELRDEIVRFIRQDGILAERDNILVLNGAKQALDLALRALVDKGDTVIVSRPTYLSALSIIRNHQASILEIDMDEDGMKVDDLASTLKRMRTDGQAMPKLLFEVPDFHNPTGITLSEERRRRLAELAEEFDFFILEDDPYRRLRFQGTPVPPIKTFDRHERVIGAGTFSKILAPGIRVGWANAQPPIVRRMAALKSEGGCCPLTQRIVYDLLKAGRIDHHITELTPVMKLHRDTMVGAFRKYLPEASMRVPHGGYFLWVELPAGINANDVARAAEQEGVAVFPGQLSFAANAPVNFIRLAYSFCRPAQIDEGIRKLSDVIRRKQNSTDADRADNTFANRHFD